MLVLPDFQPDNKLKVIKTKVQSKVGRSQNLSLKVTTGTDWYCINDNLSLNQDKSTRLCQQQNVYIRINNTPP